MMECDKCGYSDNGTGDMAHHCGGIKNLTMTNTPMTLDEMRFQFEKANQVQIHELAPEGYYRFATLQSKWIDWQKAWQASQAHQAQTIAELVEALERIGKYPTSRADEKDHRACRQIAAQALAKLRG